MKKIYFATGNKQKLARMQELAAKVADDFVIQKVPDLIDVEENGTTPVENAMQKVDPYQNLDAPIKRVASLDCHVAYSPILEDEILVQTSWIEDAIKDLLEF